MRTRGHTSFCRATHTKQKKTKKKKGEGGREFENSLAKSTPPLERENPPTATLSSCTNATTRRGHAIAWTICTLSVPTSFSPLGLQSPVSHAPFPACGVGGPGHGPTSLQASKDFFVLHGRARPVLGHLSFVSFLFALPTPRLPNPTHSPRPTPPRPTHPIQRCASSHVGRSGDAELPEYAARGGAHVGLPRRQDHQRSTRTELRRRAGRLQAWGFWPGHWRG